MISDQDYLRSTANQTSNFSIKEDAFSIQFKKDFI